jgi:hypothetical protein
MKRDLLHLAIISHILYGNKFFQFLKRVCLILFALIFILKSGVSQERNAFDLVMNPNDKATVEDVIETTQKTSKETQEKIQEGLDKWKKLESDSKGLSPSHPLRIMIDKVNATGFKNKIGAYQKHFKRFDSGLSNLLAKKEKLDNIIHFYDRYKPDAQNPFRSLEVLNNVFTDVESLLPKEKEYEYFRNTTVWLIRTGIGYYKMAIGNALNGLKNIQKLIKDRAGDCIGYIGGDGTADRSDPKRKAFVDLNTGDIICYTGLRPVGGKIYTNQTGANVYIWDSKKWTKFACGLGDVEHVFLDYRLAYGSTATSDRMIYLCNQRLGEITKARARGLMQFNRISTIQDYSCRYYILEKLGKLRDLQSFMYDVDHNQKLFVAKYIFKKDGVRISAEMFAKIVTENVKFEGYVKDENDKGIPFASVSIEAGSQVTTVITNKYGNFNVLTKIPEKDHSGIEIRIKATADNYLDFEEKTVLQGQCMNLGKLEMKVDGQLIIQPASSTISMGETVDFSVLYIDADGLSSDVTTSALTNSQFTGYSAGTFPVTATYNNISISASVEVTEMACKENEIWDATIEACICLPGYERDETGECVVIDTSSTIDVLPPLGITPEEINNQLNNADCANMSDAIAKWDRVSEQVICSCTKDYHTWDAGLKKCVPNVQAILANSDCSQWPNTEPKWDYNTNEPYCDCVSGYQWNDDYTECLSKQELAVAQADCSQYPNSQPILDPVSQEIICDCLPGYEWHADGTKCVSKALAEMQNFDCSMFPNTEAVWDLVSEQAYCDCLPGFEWNEKYTACEEIQQQQQAQYDCSHLPNTRPIIDKVLNEVVCDCMPGYKWNSGQTGCIPIPRKPTVDWGNIINMTVGIMDAVNGNTQGLMPPGYNPGTGGQGVPQSMQPPVRHQSNCNDQQQAGGDPPEEHTIDLGQSYGSFTFDYNTVSQKDQIIVTNGGVTIFNSGCVGESKSIELSLKGYSPTITVRVNPNCEGGSGTAWYFTVHCPDN